MWRPGGGVDVQAGGAGQLVVGNPVPGGDDRIAADGAPAAAVQVLDLHRFHPGLAVDPGDAGPGGDGDVKGEASGGADRGIGLGGGVLAGHQHGAASGLAQGDDGGPADQLGADDDGTAADVGVVEVDQVLQLAGGVDAVGPVAGSGGEHDRAGVQPAAARR